MTRGAVPAQELATTLVGCGIAQVSERHSPVLSLRPADQEATVHQDNRGTGTRADAGEVDGGDRTSALIATDRQTTIPRVLDPPGGAPGIAEVGIDVAGVEGGSRSAVELRAQFAILIELADLRGGAAGLDFDRDIEAHRHVWRHLGCTGEAEAGRGVGVVEAPEGTVAVAVVPPQGHAMHLTSDGQ